MSLYSAAGEIESKTPDPFAIPGSITGRADRKEEGRTTPAHGSLTSRVAWPRQPIQIGGSASIAGPEETSTRAHTLGPRAGRRASYEMGGSLAMLGKFKGDTYFTRVLPIRVLLRAVK
jgi:hypothetical protein